MNAKRFVLGMMTACLWAASVRAPAHAQAPGSPPVAPPVVQSPPLTEVTPPGAGPLGVMPSDAPTIVGIPQAVPGTGSPTGYDVPGVSNWIRREPSCCKGPFGRDTEIGSELYFRSGVSLPLGDGKILSRNMAAGFSVEGGARTFFPSQSYTKAWYVDTAILNTQNSGITHPESFVITIPHFGANNAVVFGPVTVTPRDINRTFVSLGIGREWYFGGTSQDCGAGRWRVGVDGGGRYGTMRMNFREAVHRVDVIGAAYTGAHALYEFPCYHSIVNIGLRTEYSYTWSDLLQRATDMSELNIMMQLGVRY